MSTCVEGPAVVEHAVGVLIGRGARDAGDARRLLARFADHRWTSLEDAAREVLEEAQRRAVSGPMPEKGGHAEFFGALGGDPHPELPARIADLAATSVPGTVGASITLLRKDLLRTVAATSAAARDIDEVPWSSRWGHQPI